MMYSAGFVVVVKNENGQVLRENKNKEVFLPYNSQYSILIKNKNNRRAVASVFIDGTDVLGGQRLIIDENSDFNLERFCIDGDLYNGKKFKFVEKNHPDVQDPTSLDLGQIRVRFWLEKDKASMPLSPPMFDPHSYWINPTKPWQPYKPWDSRNPLQPYEPWAKYESSVIRCNYTLDDFSKYGENETGGTVEGGQSSQSFNTGYVGELEYGSTDIVLQLRANKQSITVQNSKHIYCPVCGAKNLRSSNFCTNCGARLVK